LREGAFYYKRHDEHAAFAATTTAVADGDEGVGGV
jgi:hypothetical protein